MQNSIPRAIVDLIIHYKIPLSNVSIISILAFAFYLNPTAGEHITYIEKRFNADHRHIGDIVYIDNYFYSALLLNPDKKCPHGGEVSYVVHFGKSHKMFKKAIETEPQCDSWRYEGQPITIGIFGRIVETRELSEKLIEITNK